MLQLTSKKQESAYLKFAKAKNVSALAYAVLKVFSTYDRIVCQISFGK